MFELARGYLQTGMLAYSQLPQHEFECEPLGYRSVKHQSFVGTGYFDRIAEVIPGGNHSTAALQGSTEEEQFETLGR